MVIQVGSKFYDRDRRTGFAEIEVAGFKRTDGSHLSDPFELKANDYIEYKRAGTRVFATRASEFHRRFSETRKSV